MPISDDQKDHENLVEFHGLSGVPGQGPYFQVTVTVADGVVTGFAYATTECVWATLTGITLGRLVEGQPLRAVALLTEQNLRSAVLDLPTSNDHFVVHALAALRTALESRHDCVSPISSLSSIHDSNIR